MEPIYFLSFCTDLGNWSRRYPHEKWFRFSFEQKPEIKQYDVFHKVNQFISLLDYNRRKESIKQFKLL